MPPDLTAFAKQFDIQLLTHNDPKGEADVFIYGRQKLFIWGTGGSGHFWNACLECAQPGFDPNIVHTNFRKEKRK